MRHIDRLAEPGILTKKKAQWLADFLASGKIDRIPVNMAIKIFWQH